MYTGVFRSIRNHERTASVSVTSQPLDADPSLEGNLAICPLSDLIQLLDRQQVSGILWLVLPDGPGCVDFHAGEVISAAFDDRTHEEALVGMLRFNTGSFSFHPRDPVVVPLKPVRDPRPISSRTTALLLEACRRIDARFSG